MMNKIRHVNILSLAKFQALLLGLIGLVCGILYSFGGLIIDAMVSLGWASSEFWETPGLSYGTILAMGAFIGMPVIGAVTGFALGIVEAILFNLCSRWFGGTRLNYR